ncbi:peptidoglycan-binding protein [Pararhizobium sp.]|uniref:peptidoglycan-binding protein n=1 Tax=Pararhizobium sp. TaxID=1977563 RepID=UPI00271DD3F3|nr:peptidoglycan-binding protein [Pararhizobium sp.]MDO9415802.1 peptidoglycan-binding protein [Pararhizobium sp.]
MQLEGTASEGRLSPADTEKRLKLGEAQRREIQLALKQLGYAIGTTDGAFGKTTRREIARYQKALGLPETGFLSDVTLARLNIPVVATGDEVYSAEEARRYNVDDLKGLETDERVLKAVNCVPNREIIYGVYESHLYVVVYYGGEISWQQAEDIAKQCGTHLATITSSDENTFVASLAHTDYRLFNITYGDGETHKMGPWIGLYQDPGGREPRGGWRWANDETFNFSSWHRNKPNEHKSGDDFGMFYTSTQGTVDMSEIKMTTWDDMGPEDGTYSFVMEFD